MLEKTRRFSIAIFGSRLTLAFSVIALALLVNAPNAQQSTAAAGSSWPTIRVPVYERLAAAQACMENEDIDCARRTLDSLAAMEDLTTYETAQLYNFNAFVALEADDVDGTIRAYESILGLPRDELPEALVQASMRNLAMLYVREGRYEEGLETYDEWLDDTPGERSPNDLYLNAAILYQMERYEDALEPIEAAIAAADEPVESHYQMLYVLRFQTDDTEGAIETLELMNARWPSERWAEALAGARLGQQAAVGDLDVSTTIDSDQRRASSQDEYLPMVKVAPVYPQGAAARGLEGYVVLSYTVNERGETEDIEVMESTATEFEQAAIESVEKYRYRPRIVDGRAVAVEGLATRVVFELSSSDP